MNNACEGIVLRQQEYKDNDMILSVYTKEYGLLSFVARGIKKANSKNASACSLFCLSRFYFNYHETNSIQMLKTVDKIIMYRHLYDDLLKQTIASILVEMSEKINTDAYEYLFLLLNTSLKYLNEGNNDYGVLAFFSAKCNELAGINPNVDHCVFCGNATKIAAISIRDGGFVCQHCLGLTKLTKTQLTDLQCFRIFHKAQLNDYPVLAAFKQYEYENIHLILMMFMEYSGINLKSLNFLYKIINIDHNV